MKKCNFFILLLFWSATLYADIIDLHLNNPSGSDRTEVTTGPKASYDENYYCPLNHKDVSPTS